MLRQFCEKTFEASKVQILIGARQITFRVLSILLDRRICPSVEILTPVISSVCAFSTWISGLLPHPVFMVQSYRRHIIQVIKHINQTVRLNTK
jgi:hypothetical protein